MNLFKPLHRTGRRRRGVTFVEMVVATAVFALISMFIAFLTREVAIQARRTLNFVPASGDTHRMMDKIRSELLGAEIMSCVVYNNNSGISYKIPSRPSSSAIWFDTNERKMYFRETADEPEICWSPTHETIPLVNSFSIRMPNARSFTVTLVGNTKNRDYDDITLTYQDTVTLRN